MIANRLFSPLSQVCFFLFANFVLAALQNVTVDDAVLTGPVLPVYLPILSDWSQGNQCTICAARPDPSLAYNGTWHDTTFYPNSNVQQELQFTFVGSGLYIFFILANNLGVNITTLTNLEFILDNVQVATFTHNPTTSTNFDYNQTVYANNSIPYGEHTMTVAPVNDSSNSVLILFDYLIYTTDTNNTAMTTSSLSTASSSSPTSSATTSSSPNVGAIVGGTVAGVSALVLATIFAICYHRHKRRTTGSSLSSDNMDVIEPFVSSPQMAVTSSQADSSPIQGVAPPTSSMPGRKLDSSPTASTQLSNTRSTPTQSSLSNAPRSRDNAEILEQVGMLRNEVARLRRVQDQAWSDPEVRSEMPPEYS